MATYSRFGVGLAAMFRVWFEPDFAKYYVAWLGGHPPGVPQPEPEPTNAALALGPTTAEQTVKPVSEAVKQSVAQGTNTDNSETSAEKPESAKDVADKPDAKELKEVAPVAAVVAPDGAVASDSVVSEDALLLLGLFQREGRLIDFLEQDVVSFSDDDVGAAARLVHAGCRKVLHQYLTIQQVRSEAEGTSVTLASGYEPNEYKLVGEVPSSGSIQGRLRHPGWRATAVKLPSKVGNVDLRVLAPAEVEI